MGELHIFDFTQSLELRIAVIPEDIAIRIEIQLLGLLSDVDVLILNKKEAKQIVDGNILAEIIARISNYVPAAIVTDGNQGAIATDGNETYRIGLYEDVPIKDATGAGDSFGSGFLAAYADGRSFKESLIFASANSTSVVQKIGSKTGILNKHTKLHDMPIQEVR